MIQQYDRQIEEAKEIFSSFNMDSKAFAESWSLCPQDELILKSDMALELGANGRCGLSGIFFTTNSQLIPDKLIAVKGNCFDSPNPDDAVDYVRFVFVKLKKDLVEGKEPQQLYAIFRKLDYIRYHVFPEGFSLRISSQQHKEVVRVSKEAVARGISLEAVGQTFADAYKRMPEVESVQVYIVAQKKTAASDSCGCGDSGDAQFQQSLKRLKEIALSGERITESLNVIFQGLEMDCSTCGQKSICDEIEGMKELHQRMV